MSEGVDYSWSRPGGAALAAAGKSFAGRYLYPGGGKGLTASEVNDLHAHGILLAPAIFESSATRTLDGFVAGVADARTAQSELGACGLPSDQVVYFGADFDATDGQMAAIDDYLRGVGSFLGQGRVGVYGSYRVTTHCRASGSAPHGFQTYAWSHGQVDGGASFYQYNNGQNVNGSVDFVRSNNNAELSQTGSLTPLGENMPLDASDQTWLNGLGQSIIDQITVKLNAVPANVWTTTLTHPTGVVGQASDWLMNLSDAVAALKSVTAPGASVNPDALVAALKPYFDGLPAAVRSAIIK